jgi:hypothetical protein
MSPRRLFFLPAYVLARSQCSEPVLEKLVRPGESLAAFYPYGGTQVPNTNVWFVRMRAADLAPKRIVYRIEEGVGCHMLAMETYEVAAVISLADLEFLDDAE